MSVWTERDFVVLRYLHDHPPRDGYFSTNWTSKKPHPDLPQLTEQDVHVAIETLDDEGLIQYRNDHWNASGGVHWIDLQVSGAGLQALGQWPVFDALGSPEELGQLLDALADIAATDEEENNLRKAAATARSKGREALQSLAAGAIGAVVRGQIG